MDANGNSSVTLDPIVSNVENFYFLAADSDASDTNTLTAEMKDVTSVEQVWADRMQANLTADNVENAAVAGVINGGKNGNSSPVTGQPYTFTMNYQDDALDDADYTQAVALDNANAQLAVEANNTSGPDDTITGLELDLTGDNKVVLAGTDLNAAALTTVTTTGSGSIDLDMTSNAAANHDITLGDGDDTLRIDGTNLDAQDAIDLGAGENALLLGSIADESNLNALTLDGVSNYQALGFTDDLAIGGGSAGTDANLDIGSLDELTFEGAVDANASGSAGLNVTTAASELTINTEGAVGGTAAPNLSVSEGVSSLVLNAEDAVTLDDVSNEATPDNDTLESLTLNDVSEDGDVAYDVDLGVGEDVAGLSTIVLDGQAETNYTINAAAANFGSEVTIQLNDAGIDGVGSTDALDYSNATNTVRETFQFTGENIGDVTIGSFDVGESGGADRLDFSQFEGVDSLQDVAVTLSGGGSNVEITATADQFDGTIELTGVDNVTAVEDNAFDFA
ncbi:hypothetical protein [Vreelandella jeotgali]|uniref:hypothetical protein n=1 Tax=Vreelandella jeotgali TaxID=553386 RepID=UPI00034B8CD4|nr:hypothetical protein [Halomonas jeotgali]